MPPDRESTPSSVRSPARSREFLSSTALFGDLPADAVDEVLERAELVHLAGGEVLFRQGEAGDAMYLVISGRVQIVVETATGEVVAREMGRGENFGELALLTDDPRAATVRAVRDTELLGLRLDAFTELVESRPNVAVSLTRILARWVREGHDDSARRRQVATVALVPGDPGVDHQDLARRLAASLERHGSVLLLEADTVNERLGPGSARAPEGTLEHRRATDWLGHRELEHRFLLYVSGTESDPWSRRCLRQADAVLVVVGAGADRDLLPPARDAVSPEDGRSRAQLLLLHGAGAGAPQGTGAWLRTGSFTGHHHLREGVSGDVDRLARHLAGRAVGVVLGGGGARGFAHVGVVRALGEAGVPVDRLGGVSMGSLVAGMFAAGMEAQEVEDTLRWAWERSGNKPHRNLTLPVYALVTGEQVRRMLTWAFGDRRIEDLWTPFFCTTTNLSRGESRVHREGPVARWIEASVSIPGIVPPVVTDEGELLVDGALLDNLPTAVMMAEAHGPVVAVSVSSDQELRVEPGNTRAPSGWQAVTGRLLPFREAPAFPNIFRILHRSAVLGSVQSERDARERVDVYLEPPMKEFDMFDWSSLGRIVEVGYRYASERLAAEPDLVRALVEADPTSPEADPTSPESDPTSPST